MRSIHDETVALDLVQRISNGDRSAEKDLVLRYRGFLVALLKHRGDAQDAEDLAHDALLVLLERLRGDSIAEPGKLLAFLSRIAINKSIAARRTHARRKTEADSDAVDCYVSDSVAPVDQLAGEEVREQVRSLIRQLSVARDKTILQRRYILEQDKMDICCDLKLTSRQFDQVSHRARSRLRALAHEVDPERMFVVT